MKYLKYGLIGLAGVTILLLGWGMAIEPYLIDEREEIAEIPGLPAAWEGQRIALIADLQVGMWLANTSTIRRIVDRLIERQPALVLIAGDFIYRPTGEETIEEAREEFEPEEIQESLNELDEAIELIKPLMEAGIPVYAVLGNHDYSMLRPGDIKLEWLAQRVREALTAAGVTVLDNKAVAVAPPKHRPPLDEDKGNAGSLYVVGIGCRYANNDKPAVALAQVPNKAPRLVLMHHPDSFAKFPANTAPFAMAAHTHGGQIRLPFTPEWSWMNLIVSGEVYADGWIKAYGQPGNRLYVNRGIGFSMIPVRINAVPEVTLFTLRGTP